MADSDTMDATMRSNPEERRRRRGGPRSKTGDSAQNRTQSSTILITDSLIRLVKHSLPTTDQMYRLCRKQLHMQSQAYTLRSAKARMQQLSTSQPRVSPIRVHRAIRLDHRRRSGTTSPLCSERGQHRVIVHRDVQHHGDQRSFSRKVHRAIRGLFACSHVQRGDLAFTGLQQSYCIPGASDTTTE